MATISSSGIGSGLDVESIITKLVALEKRPITTLQTKASAIQSKLSTVGTIKSQMSTLYDSAFKLSLDSSWNGATVTSSNSSAVTGTISGIAKASSFSVGVSQLAQAQSTVSSVVDPNVSIGAGTLKIDLGVWTTSAGSSSFAQSSTVNVAISASADSLAEIAAQINDASAGVTATVLTDTSGQRMVITSNATGKEAGFRITATDSNNVAVTDGSGLSQFAFVLPATPLTTPYGMASNSYQSAQNALATVNGVSVESATNTFKDGVPGVTLDFSAMTTTPVTIRVANDKTAIKANIQSFVDAYNAVIATLNDATKYDAQTKTAGILQGDTTAVNLKNALRSMLMSATAGSTYTHLSDVGLDLNTDGKMSVNDAQLASALEGIDNLKKLFAIDNGNSGTNGIARKLKDFARGLLATDGAVTAKTDALQAAITRNSSEQDKVSAHATAVEARLRKQYTALDVKMAGLTALNTYVTQQIQSWNNNKS